MQETRAENEARWTKYATDKLVGRTIVGLNYMTDHNADELEWHNRPLVLELDDGTLLVPQRDDEGNDGGAMTWENGNEYGTFPVLPAE